VFSFEGSSALALGDHVQTASTLKRTYAMTFLPQSRPVADGHGSTGFISQTNLTQRASASFYNLNYTRSYQRERFMSRRTNLRRSHSFKYLLSRSASSLLSPTTTSTSPQGFVRGRRQFWSQISLPRLLRKPFPCCALVFVWHAARAATDRFGRKCVGSYP
jgi:hypothetical protein